MSDAIFQRSLPAPPEARAARRPIPVGYGLLAAAAVSLTLWAGAVWLTLAGLRLIGLL
jgi:hypothetical protein